MLDDDTLADLRREFPVTGNMTYLDSAHQAPLAASVKAAIERFLTEGSQTGGPKWVWLERVEKVRARLAQFIGAEASEIAFTRNTSEGLNGAANALPLGPGDNVIAVEADHPNLTYAFLNLARRGVETRFVPMSETLDGDSFDKVADVRTKAIALSNVAFHSGLRFDLTKIGRYCRERGILLVMDGTQSVGVMPLDVKAFGLSFAACSTHKGLLVPHGLGFLFVDSGLKNLEPAYLSTSALADAPADLIARPDNLKRRSGARQFEFGNYNILGIHALDASLDLIDSVGPANIEAHVLDVGEYLIAQLDAAGIELLGPRERKRRSHVHLVGLPAAAWVPFFREQKVRVSPERGNVRVSLAMFNSTKDIDDFTRVIAFGRKQGVGVN